MLNLSSNSSSELQHRFEFLKVLLYKHPFTVCCGIWVLLVLLGGAATLGLFNPGPVEQEKSQPLPPLTTFEEVAQKPPTLKIWKKSTPNPSPLVIRKEATPKQSSITKSQESSPENSSFTSSENASPKPDIPLWVFATVALGCAGGSLLVTQMLKYSARRDDNLKRLKPVGTIRKKRPNPPKSSRPAPKPQPPIKSSPSSQTLHKQTIPQQNLTQITVLPPEQSHPLDDGQRENLAEVMDLRKRYSLNSLMRDK